jgi:hypothetical protein
MAESKAKSKTISPTNLVKEEEKAEVEAEAELGPEKKEENLGKASPKDISDTHLLLFPRQAKKPLRGSNPENVHPYSDARCHASLNLCKVFEGYPQPEVTNTRDR